MWRGEGRRGGAKDLFIVIGEDTLDWMLRSRAGKPCTSWQQLAVVGAGEANETDEADMCQALAGLVLPSPPRQIRVVVADRWLAQAVLPWQAGASAGDARQQWVQQGLLASGHRAGADDVLRWDEAAPDTPRLCVAYPGLLLQALQQCAQRLGAPLRSVLPLSTLAWRGMRQRHATVCALLVAGRHGLLLASGQRQGAGAGVRTLVWRRRVADGTPHTAELHDFWQRLVWRDCALAASGQIGVLSLAAAVPELPSETPSEAPRWLRLSDAPLAWLANVAVADGTALDAIAPMPWWRSPWHWCICGLVLLAALMLVQAQRTRSEADALARQLAALRAAPARAARPVISTSAATPERAHAVNRAVAQLNVPVAAILRALAPPPDINVALLSVEWRPPETEAKDDIAAIPIRLVASAGGVGEMVRYVDFLEHQPKVAGLALHQHEIVADGQQWRFVTQLAWRATP